MTTKMGLPRKFWRAKTSRRRNTLRLLEESVPRCMLALAGILLISGAAFAEPPPLAELARAEGRPQLPGLNIVYLTPLGKPTEARRWTNILVDQTEGPAGSAKNGAAEQVKNPTRRGVTIWVETDGTVYWATAENAVPTHGDGANRNDSKYIDNAKTFHKVT